MPLDAGSLRDRVSVQARLSDQDSGTGAMVVTWPPVEGWQNLPAKIEDLSQRDLIAAQAMQSTVTKRVILRYFPGLTSTHRLVDHEGRIYTLEGPPIRDKESRQEFMTLSVSEGPSDGE